MAAIVASALALGRTTMLPAVGGVVNPALLLRGGIAPCAVLVPQMVRAMSSSSSDKVKMVKEVRRETFVVQQDPAHPPTPPPGVGLALLSLS